MIACTEPGCTGTYEDGYCNVCGSPQAATERAPRLPPRRPRSWARGSPRRAPTAPRRPPTPTPSGRRAPGRTSSSRLATAALGSARTAATGGSRPTRRVGTSSTRLRGARLGAGLTTVPPAPVQDPLQAVMAVAEVPERKRFCPACGAEVGRSRDGVPGRTAGFCPKCGNHFDFTPALNPGDVVGGQYEVVGCLAHGGLGWIYLARDRNVSGRWVVLKGLLNSGDPDAYAAAISERQFLAEVEHPLIVEIYNFAMHEGAGYTVMEFVGGRSLKQILQDRRDANAGVNTPLPVDQALAFILEILPAFAYLHDVGLLFCDFKPDNVIQQGDAVKLIDLGGVRRIDDLDSAIFGTVGYQAPEVAEVGPSVASDIYTIGRTLATLVLDFRGNTSTYVASLPAVADTPVFQTYDSFYRLLAKACALDPSDRFATVDELRAQVLGVLREVVATDRGPGSPALHSAASVLFEAPTSDEAGHPLAWDQLPALKVDASDPAASWLAGRERQRPRAAHRSAGRRAAGDRRGPAAQDHRGDRGREPGHGRPHDRADPRGRPVGVAGRLAGRARAAEHQGPDRGPCLVQRRLRPGARRAGAEARAGHRVRAERRAGHRGVALHHLRALRRQLHGPGGVRAGPHPPRAGRPARVRSRRSTWSPPRAAPTWTPG